MCLLLPVVGLLNLGLLLAVRLGVTRLIGLRAAGLWPLFPAYRRQAQGQPKVPWHKQLWQVLAGWAAVYGLAGCLFATSFRVGGRSLPDAEAAAIVEVMAELPAAAAGLQDGDRIVEVAGKPVPIWGDLPPLVRQHPGETLAVVVERDGRRLRFEVAVDARGRMGVRLRPQAAPVGAGEAIWLGAKEPLIVSWSTASGLWQWLTGRVTTTLGGPVAIVRQSRQDPDREAAQQLRLLGIWQTYYGLPSGLLLAFFMRLRRYQPPGAARPEPAPGSQRELSGPGRH